MEKFTFVASSGNKISSGEIEAETIEDARYKIIFELGYNDIIELEAVVDKFKWLKDITSKVKSKLEELKSTEFKFRKDGNVIDYVDENINETENISDIIINFSNDYNGMLSGDTEIVKKLEVVKVGKVKFKLVLGFFEKLCVLLKSDVSIVKGIDIIRSNSVDKNFKRILGIMCEDLRNGEKLSSSMSRFPNVFDDLHVSLISAGEKSGALVSVLEDLVVYLKMMDKVKKKIKTMTIYPKIVVVFVSGLLVAGGYIVYPKIQEMFKSFGMDVPIYTKVTLLGGKYIYIVYVLILLYKLFRIIAKNYIYKIDIFINETIDKISLKVPILRDYVKVSSLYNYTNTLYVMLKNNINLINALDYARETIRNVILKDKFKDVTSNVVKGKKLSVVYKELNVEPLLSEMVSIGEESGKLVDSFKNMVDYFNTELIAKTEALIELFQPITILLLGSVIAPIIISILIPLLKLTSGYYIK
ncbi:MAG: type II secretion system F family protein [Candidatus Anstonellales archaeon]